MYNMSSTSWDKFSRDVISRLHMKKCNFKIIGFIYKERSIKCLFAGCSKTVF